MSLLTHEDFLLELNASSQKEVLRELAKLAYKRGKVNDEFEFFNQLCLREQESTTGFGNGVAIPHARHNCVIEAGVIVARIKTDIEWNALDGLPVNVCICLIAPNDKNDVHLNLLSKLARKLIDDDFIKMLKSVDKETLLIEINKVLN